MISFIIWRVIPIIVAGVILAIYFKCDDDFLNNKEGVDDENFNDAFIEKMRKEFSEDGNISNPVSTLRMSINECIPNPVLTSRISIGQED
jgi:hypothetical protein